MGCRSHPHLAGPWPSIGAASFCEQPCGRGLSPFGDTGSPCRSPGTGDTSVQNLSVENHPGNVCFCNSHCWKFPFEILFAKKAYCRVNESSLFNCCKKIVASMSTVLSPFREQRCMNSWPVWVP